MVKFKTSLKFDKNVLKELKDDSNSGVELHKAPHHFSLHPIQLNDFGQSIKDILNQGIAKYNKKLDGILLGYQNVKLLSDKGLIVNDSCYIHMDLVAEFFVFKPEIGKEMQGTVNRRTKDHIGILVYDAFNVSIPKPEDEEDWLGDSVDIGYKVLFRITYINLLTQLPYIRGELISILSKTDDNANYPNQKEGKTKGKKNKSKKGIDEETPEDETPIVTTKKGNEEDEEVLSPRKNKKKKRKNETSGEDHISGLESPKKHKLKDNVVYDEETPRKKKKNKIKKELNEAEESLEDMHLSRLFEESELLSNEINSLSFDKSIKSELDSEGNGYLQNEPTKKKKKKKHDRNEETIDNENSFYMENIKCEIDSDISQIESSGKRKHKKKSDKVDISTEDEASHVRKKKSKKKEKSRNEESSDSPIDSQSKKSRKRKHSLGETEFSIKKHRAE